MERLLCARPHEGIDRNLDKTLPSHKQVCFLWGWIRMLFFTEKMKTPSVSRKRHVEARAVEHSMGLFLQSLGNKNHWCFVFLESHPVKYSSLESAVQVLNG